MHSCPNVPGVSIQRSHNRRRSISLLMIVFAFVFASVIIALPHRNTAQAASPTITLGLLAGGPGTPLTLNGSGFGTSESVKIYWNYTGPGTGTLLTTATSDTNGSFSAHSNAPTGTTPGYIPIAAIGQTSNLTAMSQFYFYPPTLTLAPLNGSAGTIVTLTAYGFQGLETVKIYWNSGPTPVLTGKVNTFGYLLPVTFMVPASTAPGTYQIMAVGQTTHISIKNTYDVVPPSSTLHLSTGPVGVTEEVTGQGYAPGETVDVLWNYTGPGTGTLVSTASVRYSGTFSANFAVPGAAAGPHEVAAVGQSSGRSSENSFTLAKGLASSPTTTPPGVNITVTGSGYQANESVALKWDSPTGSLLSTAVADASGNINQLVTTPSSATPGAHSIVGVGQTSLRSFTASVTVDTSWGDFGFDLAHHRQNPYENTVGKANVSNLKLKWSATTGSALESSPVYANGIVYIGTYNGMLDAYDAITGKLKWQFDTHTGFQIDSSPLVDPVAGIVTFGTIGARNNRSIPTPFYALDAQTGTLKWSLILPWEQFAFPTLYAQTVYVGISQQASKSALYALDEISGRIDWFYRSGGGVWGAIAVDPNTNTIFTGIGDPAFQLTAFDATSGAVRWQILVPHPHVDDDPCSGIVLANGLVYLDSKNGNVLAYHESDGTLAWSTPIGPVSSGNVSSPAVAANGMLYVGSHDGNLYVLNALNGTVIRKIFVGGGIDSSPMVANGVVYFASYNHNFYAVNAATKAILWSYHTGGLSYSSPIVVNGWLYCESTDGNVYAFSL